MPEFDLFYLRIIFIFSRKLRRKNIWQENGIFLPLFLSNMCKGKKWMLRSHPKYLCTQEERPMQSEEMQNLVEKARQKEPDAFTELMQLYLKDMYRIAIAILLNDEDAADAIQDTILACWEKIDTLKSPQYVKTWIIRILIHNCYKIRKHAKNTETLEACEEPVIYDEYNLELKEALSSLDEKYRMVMILFYSEGYHISEIAKILKIPKSTVQTRLHRGRRKLAKDYFGIEEGA
jgi:RNA polymerase sigma factor (sigma-70 family)